MCTRNLFIFWGWLLLSAALIFTPAATGQAQAKTVTWKMATKMPPTSSEGKAFQRMADLVKEKSDGAMVIQVFPAEQLGKTEAILEQLQAGVIQIYPEGTSYLQKFVEDLKFTNAPFIFDDREHWVRFMDSELVQSKFQEVAEKHNVLVLGKSTDFVRGPYRVMVSRREVKGLDDIRGLKLRLHPDDIAIAAWKHLGASVIVLPWTDIYESLGRGIIDACNSPMALVESMKFYEQAKHVIRHNEFPQGMAFMTNYEQFKQLSPEHREILLKSHKEACDYSVEIMNQVAEESIEQIENAGAKYYDIDTQPFVKKMLNMYKQWEKEGKLPSDLLRTIQETK